MSRLTPVLHRSLHRRYCSARPNFFARFIDNVKQELAKNKEMEESIKRFREEASKLERSDALKKARAKFEAIEAETLKGGKAVKKKLEDLKDKVMEEAAKSELAKKAGELKAGIDRAAGAQKERLEKNRTFRTLSKTAMAIKEELEGQGLGPSVYRSPRELRKRCETASALRHEIKPDNRTVEVELHKDSRFYKSWQEFKDNNRFLSTMQSLRARYRDSDNTVVAASRAVVDTVLGGFFRTTELSATLTEICKYDPDFTEQQFLRDCEKDVVPNVLEALNRGRLDVLKDWCHSGLYAQLEPPLRRLKDTGHRFCSKLLDIDNLELITGKVIESGPVLVISFTTQEIRCVRDADDNVVQGSPDSAVNASYMWVLSRDLTEVNPKAAWRLLESHTTS